MSAYKVISYSGSDPALAPYKNLIYASFMKSLRFGNEWFKEIESDAYYAIYRQVIDALLARTDSVVKLALVSDDLDTCLGWSMSEGTTLHYVFVKGDSEIGARKNGIGQSLIPEKIDRITHLTKTGRHIWKNNQRLKSAIFNPFF